MDLPPATERLERSPHRTRILPAMSEVTGSVVTYPARASFLGYLLLIWIGGLTLALPISQAKPAEPIRFLDALFTSTSAVCVTGLTVVGTGSAFSHFGQFVIMALIQIGGIGIITVTTLLTLRLGGGRGLRNRQAMMETLGADENTDVRTLLRRVVGLTLVIELIGAAFLFGRNLFHMPPPQALWHAWFHSVAAFCNAGFAIPDNNLMDYRSDWVTNLTVMGLIVVGGLGFPVLIEMGRNYRRGKGLNWEHMTVHAKVMLIGTALLLVGGTAAILFLEWDGVLYGLPWHDRLLTASFQAVVPRTAGFNTVDIGELTNATLFIMVILMFIGAGPCSTGGGFKVTTFMTMIMRAWTTFLGRPQVRFFRRSVPGETVERANAVALMFAVTATVALLFLLVLEQHDAPHREGQDNFLDALFEVASALGTVGLSTGLTPNLTDPGKIILILLMFVGRLGPIAVVVALSRGRHAEHFEYPEERPMIG